MITELHQCFLLESPWLSFFIIAILITIAGTIINNIFCRLPLRFMRYLVIRKYGYPPPHCDADGDFPAAIKIQDLTGE